MIKKDDDNFERSTNYWVCNMDFLYNNVKVKDHSCITGKHKGSAQIVVFGSN